MSVHEIMAGVVRFASTRMAVFTARVVRDISKAHITAQVNQQTFTIDSCMKLITFSCRFGC